MCHVDLCYPQADEMQMIHWQDVGTIYVSLKRTFVERVHVTHDRVHESVCVP